MEQRQLSTKTYAMHFGAYMGVYWILKFILVPLSFTVPFLQFLFIGLTIGVPFMGYYYLKIYRDKICKGSITFSHAMLFVMLVYFFAAMLVSVAHFLYFQFIDNGFIVAALTNQMDQVLEINKDAADYDLLLSTVTSFKDEAGTLTAAKITLRLFSNNITAGLLLAIPTALIGKRKFKTMN